MSYYNFRLFQYGLNGDCISKNDLITLIKVAAKMPVANTVAWNFVRYIDNRHINIYSYPS